MEENMVLQSAAIKASKQIQTDIKEWQNKYDNGPDFTKFCVLFLTVLRATLSAHFASFAFVSRMDREKFIVFVDDMLKGIRKSVIDDWDDAPRIFKPNP